MICCEDKRTLFAPSGRNRNCFACSSVGEKMQLRNHLKRGLVAALAAALAVGICGLARTVHAQISKGNLILINRGLQIQGLVTPDNYFHLDTYSNANYTAVNFLWDSSGNVGPISTFLGPTPGYPWTRWVGDETNMPGMGTNPNGVSRTNEIPYANQLVSLQLGDEWNLNDDATRTRLVNWFSAVRSNWPNTILYHNSYGSQVGDAPLGDFYTRARPDMLCFDTYPWQSVYDPGQPNHTGPAIPGPPTGWYGDLRRYREHARGANIPLAIYRQLFHAVQDYDGHVFRDPSPSELRLLTFGALAFNAKFITDFTYNTGANSLFTNLFGGAGDTQTNVNGLYAEMMDINQRARSLGKALLRLKPIDDATNLYTTSMMFFRGKDPSGTTNPIPVGFIADPQAPNGYTDWVSDRNDPYLRGWVVTNPGSMNGGQPGDVIIAWFKPLDEGFDGPNYTNEIYMMVVNGLTDPTGTAADCLQEIKLNFLSVTATASVVLLDPGSGQLQTNSLPIVSTRRQLVLSLNGGDAALFKFSDGAPFVGPVVPAPAQLDIHMQAGALAISLLGTIAAQYRLEATPSLPNANWTILTNFLLLSSPWMYLDTTASNASKGFYRAVGTP